MNITMREVMITMSLYDQIKAIKLPVATAYKFSTLFKALKEHSSFYQDELTKIIEEYALRDDDGKIISLGQDTVKLQEDKLDEAQKSFAELSELEVEVPDVKFSLEELEKLELTVSDLEILTYFIQNEKQGE